MSSMLGVRFSGPLEFYAAGFASELLQLGYTSNGARAQLRLVAHLSRWLADRGLGVAVLRSPGLVEEFFAARRDAGYRDMRTPKALVPLLEFFRDRGVVAETAAAGPMTPAEVLLDRYRSYLVGERCLAASTAQDYLWAVRPFVAGLADADGQLQLDRVSAGAVAAFVLEASRNQARGSAKLVVTALRSLLRFLHVEGLVPSSLVTAVPSVASWRLAGLPKGLTADEVARLLSSCDRRTRVGRRDFAILLVLVRLGLRAGEVAHLELDDIDWRAGELVVRGKGDRHERLPLPDDVGQALVGYLQRGRPATAQQRRLFIRVRAPHRGLTTPAVSHVVLAAGQRAGLADPIRAHRLRHTAATGLLAAGASLDEIGQLLRQRSRLTTAIYAKVDRQALRSLARRWPGGGA